MEVYHKHSTPLIRLGHTCGIPQGGIISLNYTFNHLCASVGFTTISNCSVHDYDHLELIVHSVHLTYSMSVRSACSLTTALVTLHSILQNTFVPANNYDLPIPVAARSKAWVCCRSLAGTAGSNPVGRIDVCLL
jgi:hypothetical protein